MARPVISNGHGPRAAARYACGFISSPARTTSLFSGKLPETGDARTELPGRGDLVNSCLNFYCREAPAAGVFDRQDGGVVHGRLLRR